jgi:hypothetical protein
MTTDFNAPDGRTKEGKALKYSLTGGATESPATENVKVSMSKVLEKETPEQSLARAEARVRAIRDNPDLANGTERDKYWAPPPPVGFDYQWKLKSVLNQDDIDRIRQNEMNGWEAVPLRRHPELMPKGWKGETIEVGGLVLMERPKLFTDEAREQERRAAREAVITKESQMREGRSGDLGRREVNRFSKTRAPIDVPE